MAQRALRAVPLAVLCSWMALSHAAAAAETFVHTGRLLADPASGTVLENQTIVVRDGRVAEIRAGFVAGTGTHIDLRELFVLPGLIDCHVHLHHENGPGDALERVTRTPADRAIAGVRFASLTLQAGFTTVADLGGENDALFALRDGIARGDLPGPRMLASGNAISPHGGAGDVHGYRPGVTEVLRRPNLCTGADECRRVVREQIRRGADLIKIVATGSVLSDTAQGVGLQFTPAELVAIVETAHALGRRVTAHAHGADGINAALTAGVDSIEHGTFLDRESMTLFRQHRAYLVPTLLAGATLAEWAQADNGMLSPQARVKALQVGPAMLEMARRAHAGGVRIAFGTDASVARHGSNAREFALLVQAGLTPLEAIQTATVAAADHLGLAAEIGTLAPGKAADLVAVRGDPLMNVRELENIRFVMKGGAVHRHDEPGHESTGEPE